MTYEVQDRGEGSRARSPHGWSMSGLVFGCLDQWNVFGIGCYSIPKFQLLVLGDWLVHVVAICWVTRVLFGFD